MDRSRTAIASLTVAAALLVTGAGAAEASGGGVTAGGSGGGAPTTPVTPGCPNSQLGKRTLHLGDCGGDVATLNWILKAKDYALPILDDRFAASTKTAVQAFQRDADLRANGIVGDGTAAALVNAMPPQLATWYGPGFFGNQTACGQTLTKRTLGVAHRTLPCGSRVVLNYNGRFIRTTVIDRGPFANGAKWDLTQATAQALRFAYTDSVRVAKIAGP
jgi:peptidoglycan hydrolase-like protein with peptidoglycan-binding domain